MHTMSRFEMGLAETNEAVQTGTMDAVNAQLTDNTKPDAAYFGTENGRRTGYLVFDMVDSAPIPVIADPLFQPMGATVEFIQVMNADDLRGARRGGRRLREERQGQERQNPRGRGPRELLLCPRATRDIHTRLLLGPPLS
jgi:hypothetical protein